MALAANAAAERALLDIPNDQAFSQRDEEAISEASLQKASATGLVTNEDYTRTTTATEELTIHLNELAAFACEARARFDTVTPAQPANTSSASTSSGSDSSRKRRSTDPLVSYNSPLIVDAGVESGFCQVGLGPYEIAHSPSSPEACYARLADIDYGAYHVTWALSVALANFAAGRFDPAVRLLLRTRPFWHTIGGSHLQR